MNFEDGLNIMVKGGKVRRPNWGEGNCWHIKDSKLFDSDGKEINDWEEVKEVDKWTLVNDGKEPGYKYDELAVRELKKRILGDIKKIKIKKTDPVNAVVDLTKQTAEIIKTRFGF